MRGKWGGKRGVRKKARARDEEGERDEGRERERE